MASSDYLDRPKRTIAEACAATVEAGLATYPRLCPLCAVRDLCERSAGAHEKSSPPIILPPARAPRPLPERPVSPPPLRPEILRLPAASATLAP